MESKERIPVDGVEVLEETIHRVREAQKQFAAYTQEQVDTIFKAAAIAANQARLPLAKLAVEETGMGVIEDKVIKNNYAAEYIYNAYKDEGDSVVLGNIVYSLIHESVHNIQGCNIDYYRKWKMAYNYIECECDNTYLLPNHLRFHTLPQG